MSSSIPADIYSELPETDNLFQIAESLAQDFSVYPDADASGKQGVPLPGLLSRRVCERRRLALSRLDVDSYIEQVVAPAEDVNRLAAPGIIRSLGTLQEQSLDGPFYSAVLKMEFHGRSREVAFLAHNRANSNGVWMPSHHLRAAEFLEFCSRRSLPLVTMMDTPGANAEEEANRNNQAHSISRLIAEMCNLTLPNLGVILGLGYSGGAIPLAASNLIFSVGDGVFNTIQPKGLASIARRLNLSWQECAKYVGLSPYELQAQGIIDGVIDYTPAHHAEEVENLRLAILAGIESIEERVKHFVSENPYIFEHYARVLRRYLNPTESAQRMDASASLTASGTPTEFPNAFGLAYRYLRYLSTRKRIRATRIRQYGRLARVDLPRGELDRRAERERRFNFISWLQDPEPAAYDDQVSRALRNFIDRREKLTAERGRLAQLLLGEPEKNYTEAKAQLVKTLGMYLYNRFKDQAKDSLRLLRLALADEESLAAFVRLIDVREPRVLLKALRANKDLVRICRDQFSHEGRKLLTGSGAKDLSTGYVHSLLVAEINLLLTGPDIAERIDTSRDAAALAEDLPIGATLNGSGHVQRNRETLEARFGGQLPTLEASEKSDLGRNSTMLDVLLCEDLRETFIEECDNLLLFDAVYDHIVLGLDQIAAEADSTRALSEASIKQLLRGALQSAWHGVFDVPVKESLDDDGLAGLEKRFFDWYEALVDTPRSGQFLNTVEEWKRPGVAHLSDTLLVVVTFFFQRLLPSYLASTREGKRFDGRIAPVSIGRRKNFWYRLTIAYRDLLIQNLLFRFKRSVDLSYERIIETYFDQFDELYADFLSSDPCEFPGFRQSIDGAIERGLPPCGIVTGIGTLKPGIVPGHTNRQVGVVVSNIKFQAGSFDMASAEKFCRLLVDCALRKLPVVCFMSSGGMQTKEGAGALFSMAAVNDRVTRFVRDNDLPVIVFGYGDCTGGAQASFVTHPLVQTYYFSGANMPFAGQIVVQSNLSSLCTLSNYLSIVDGAMQGLVQHPFIETLDDELRAIDPDIPVPSETVPEVLGRVLQGEFGPVTPVTSDPEVVEADLIRPVKRVLIHARGCTAVKLIRVAQRIGVEVVLVQSDPDMDSVSASMLGENDQLVCIGGNTPDESYLNALSVLRVCQQERVDSLHPGIGFLSENSQFAQLCRNHHVNFIGPPVNSMEVMGNKSNAINTARSLGVGVVPGSHGILSDVETGLDMASQIGFPVLIKAVHGGGGKGLQVVEEFDQFHELFTRVTVEARAAFGSGDVYLERYVTSLRHIEVQVLRDTHGNTRILGLRDCSVQRDKQKIFEESGSTMLPPELRERVLECAASLSDAVEYVGAGTVEFIFDLKSQDIYFMEMNTRLQVEHPVTELVSGVDIVAAQFEIAGGASIEKISVKEQGYAIEARINAERLVRASDGKPVFRPDPGEVTQCFLPEDPKVEVICCIGEGREVSPYYDSLVAQIIATGTSRTNCINRLLEYLSQVRIEGICTNIELLKSILVDEVFKNGQYDTNYIEEFMRRIDVDELSERITVAAGTRTDAINVDALRIEGSDELKVLAASTGIVYMTPSPGDPEFVAIGDVVGIGDTLCQIEAMKVFTPLRLSDFNHGDQVLYDENLRYRVTRINRSSGQQISAGDLLFVLQPVDPATRRKAA